MRNYNKLVAVINEADVAYYSGKTPLYSDHEYNNLLAELKLVSESIPEAERSPLDPLLKPSGKATSDLTVTHKVPMLSIDSVPDLNGLNVFFKRSVLTAIDYYMCELKIDGVSISLEYTDGLLTSAGLRGDGTVGDDITDKVKCIKSIPKKLPEPRTVTIRGELYVTKTDYGYLNVKWSSEGGKSYANPRSFVSAMINSHDLERIGSARLRFIAFDLHDDVERTFEVKHAELDSLGLTSVPMSAVVHKDDIEYYYKDVETARKQLDFDIDGIVIKVNDPVIQSKCPPTGRYLQWARAWKFKAEEDYSKLIGVDFQVSKVGTITPVARLEPVKLGGTVISRATLHNVDELKRLDLHYGDTVVVRRAGDTIPQITASVEEYRKDNAVPVTMPTNCPCCSSKLVYDDSKEVVVVKCPNRKCPARLLRKFQHFVSKQAFNIKGFGEVVLNKLIDAGIIVTFADLYRLNYDKLNLIDSMGAKSIDKLLTALENSEETPLSKAIYGLGIPNVGLTVSETLSYAFENLRSFSNASVTELIASGACNETLAKSIVEHLNLPEVQEDISALIALEDETRILIFRTGGIVTDGCLKDTVWVITGDFAGESKETLADMIKMSGGRVSSHTTKAVTHCLFGKNPGKKMEDAIENKADLVNRKDFEEIILNGL